MASTSKLGEKFLDCSKNKAHFDAQGSGKPDVPPYPWQAFLGPIPGAFLPHQGRWKSSYRALGLGDTLGSPQGVEDSPAETPRESGHKSRSLSLP